MRGDEVDTQLVFIVYRYAGWIGHRDHLNLFLTLRVRNASQKYALRSRLLQVREFVGLLSPNQADVHQGRGNTFGCVIRPVRKVHGNDGCAFVSATVGVPRKST